MVARQAHVGWVRVVVGGLGVGLAVMAAPVAAADPAPPVDPSVLAAPPAQSADPGPSAVADAALSAPPAAPATDPSAALTPPDGVAHLPSPNSLPPGTTQEAPEHPTTGLLRDIWHALRDGEMTGPDALKLLAATRPVDQQKLAESKPSNHGAPAAPVADAPTDAPPAATVMVPAPTAGVPAS